MDIFQYPDDYKPQKYLTSEQMNQIQADLLKHPLFIKEMPQNLEDNQHLVALQSLLDEEDPNVAAQNLNNQANNSIKKDPQNQVFLKQAFVKYTQGIKIKCPDPKINAKLHCNRASINLKIKNYGKVIQDCKMSIKFDENYVKAYYRYAKALIALCKYKDCLELLKDRKEADLVGVRKEAEDALKKQQEKLNIKTQQKNKVKTELQQYLITHNYRNKARPQPLPQGVFLKLISQKLSIPLVIIYPQFNQFDLIASTFQNQKIKQHIDQLLKQPLPWDHKNQYPNQNIEVYVQIQQAVLMKVPRQVNIGELASRVLMRDAIQVMFVCKDNQFYKSYISQHKII